MIQATKRSKKKKTLDWHMVEWARALLILLYMLRFIISTTPSSLSSSFLTHSTPHRHPHPRHWRQSSHDDTLHHHQGTTTLCPSLVPWPPWPFSSSFLVVVINFDWVKNWILFLYLSFFCLFLNEFFLYLSILRLIYWWIWWGEFV